MKFWRPGPAVEQLQTTSDEILNLPAANLPVHALVGVGGNDFIAAETLYIPRPFSDFVRMLYRDEIFDGEHDLVVGEDSQIGGLPLQTTTSFPYALFPLATGTHFSTLVEERVGNRAVELLNANVGDTTFFALGFPAGPPPSGPPPPDPVLNGLADGDLVIVDPTQGETVVAGDSITVTVELPTGYDPEEMLVFSSEVGVSLDLPSLSTSLEIPEDYLGALTIGAIARNEADIFALAQDVSVEVMTYASLQSISVQNSPVLIRGLSFSARMSP